MTSNPTYAARRIVDAAAVIIAANPINEYVRTDPDGGSLSHISPVKQEFRARQSATGCCRSCINCARKPFRYVNR
ncbi:hypothetical protein [Escherichia sp. ESNIH1]|uniref:hypothetical protein n=1 Tax=Escherichia sp. ESNIH1 TaxID=1985876 RepID=UPI002570E715|nr:hypothetical protein [Escherichia sp. ESNIH1]